MAWLGIALILCAVGMLVLAMMLRRRSGLPWARVVGSDTGIQRHLERPFSAPGLASPANQIIFCNRGRR